MSYSFPSFDFYFSKTEVKQDIETYIDWDVDTKFTTSIDKEINIKANFDVDGHDNGATIEAVIKDFGVDMDHSYPAGDDNGGNGEPTSAVGLITETTAVEDAFSTSSLTAWTPNVLVSAESGAFDRQAVAETAFPHIGALGYDSATFSEINIAVDYKAGEFAILTVHQEALVDG